MEKQITEQRKIYRPIKYFFKNLNTTLVKFKYLLRSK